MRAGTTVIEEARADPGTSQCYDGAPSQIGDFNRKSDLMRAAVQATQEQGHRDPNELNLISTLAT